MKKIIAFLTGFATTLIGIAWETMYALGIIAIGLLIAILAGWLR